MKLTRAQLQWLQKRSDMNLASFFKDELLRAHYTGQIPRMGRKCRLKLVNAGLITVNKARAHKPSVWRLTPEGMRLLEVSDSG